LDLDKLLKKCGGELLVIELFENQEFQNFLSCSSNNPFYLKYTSLAGELSYYVIARAARHNEIAASETKQ
jgi:hypothetical protein